MKTIRRIAIVFVLLSIFSINAFGNDTTSQEALGRRNGPPPEAYAACEGKSAGDSAQFVSPRGETVTGTCELEGDRLVLRPDRQKARSGKRRQVPPPEAYAACEGKCAGDTAQFTGPRGKTVTGTCEQEGDLLVLRPDRLPRSNADGVTMDGASE